MRNLPINLIFYCFPLISIVARFANRGQLNYDFFWAPAFVVVLFLLIGTKFKKKYFVLFTWLSLLLFLKYVLPLFFYGNVQLYPWLMDCKWVVYLLFSIFWINRFGLPSGRVIYKGSLFFSKVYILYAIYIIIRGQLSREGILMESNYDGFMILMGFCLIDKYKQSKIDWLYFVFATLLTFSRTGLVAMILMLFYRTVRRNILYLVPLVPIFIGIVLLVVYFRGHESIENFDRFVFYNQAFVYFSETSIWNVLFGSTPGVSLKMSVDGVFQWYIDVFENLRNLRGIYPFYFHSTYLRLALTWGIFGFLAYSFFFIYKFLSSKILSMRYFCLLILVQSISLSVLTLQNVSVLFFMMLIMLIAEEKKYKMLLIKRTH